jgi:hypothetical protein
LQKSVIYAFFQQKKKKGNKCINVQLKYFYSSPLCLKADLCFAQIILQSLLKNMQIQQVSGGYKGRGGGDWWIHRYYPRIINYHSIVKYHTLYLSHAHLT